ncbi:MAG: S26 family signal peptidase [Clostridia bacterium]|nr:S26 family signal peptidase [Clostridia bacterium]
MTSYQKYTLVLCFIVFAMLVLVFSLVIAIIYKQRTKLINLGADDKEIFEEYEKQKGKKPNKFAKAFDYIVTLTFGLLFIVAFVLSTFMSCTQDNYSSNIPTYLVVKTDSMATKNENNSYLQQNNLNDQFNAMDLIVTYKLPDEKDLKLYDIVVYEIDGVLVIHRIIGIEEPNEKHPNERYFLLRGDSNDSSDRFPVKYSQMKAIYRGEHIHFVGSFVLFMQSPAGWICIILVIITMIITPILEKLLEKHRQARIDLMLMLKSQEEQRVELPSKQEEPVRVVFVPEPKEQPKKESLVDVLNRLRSKLDVTIGLLARKTAPQIIVEEIQPIIAKPEKEELKEKPQALLSENKPVEEVIVNDVQEEIVVTQTVVDEPQELETNVEENNKEVLEDELFDKEDNEDIQNEEGSPLTNFVNVKRFKKSKKNTDFEYRLYGVRADMYIRYDIVYKHLLSIEGIKESKAKTFRTYKLNGKVIAKVMIKGKSVYFYLAIDPQELNDTKYNIIDATQIKKHAKFPTCVKLTSFRQAKWTCELIDKIVKTIKEGAL